MRFRPSCFRTLIATAAISWLSVSSAAADQWQINWGYQQLLDRFFSEGVATGDINGDGHQDVVAGPFWFEGPDFAQRHRVEAGEPVDPHGYAPHFFSFTDDVNQDGRLDIVHIGFPGAAAYWLEQPKTADGEWARHDILAEADNESPTYADIDGDGKRELICSTKGAFGYATPKPGHPEQLWDFHAISPEGPAGGRFTHGMGIGDVNGDGRLDFLEKNGWWEQPESLAGNPIWKHHPFAFSGAGGSQMFAHDFDGDGDNDVLSSSPHSFGIWWHEQFPGGNWKTHEIDKSFSQTHGVCLADINGDGLMDFVTGKRWWAHGGSDPGGDQPAVFYWFELARENGRPHWIRHQFDHNSGVGTQFQVADVNGDGLL
ncbi:MAG: VCBS repeat-containing protein, partial [Planctomycetales bacterium]|nr:VCBS repeat-containing protein [Planctomycetales bacterium]